MNNATLLLIVLAVLLVLLIVRANVRSVTVFEFERGLLYTHGRYRGLVAPGRHWMLARRSFIDKVDVRPRVVSVPGQEVLSADGVAVKASVVASYHVADPAKARNEVQNFEAALYVELQMALRSVIAGSPVEPLLENRANLGERLVTLVAEPARKLGLGVSAADIKDLTLPGELKKIFAQVVRARQEGLAALEKARGETAALRSLANAAQMIERNPHLMQLRLLQVLGQQSGNTVVLGVPASGPIPLRTAEPAQLPPEAPDSATGDSP